MAVVETALPSTEALYWQDTYLFEADATVISVHDSEKDMKAVILDRTIFYPQGGGQPADNGMIVANDGKMIVADVRLKEGQVLHIGTFQGQNLKEGDKVKLVLDKDRRSLNARLHSGGHLVDIALTNIGETQLEPGKGYHFPNGAYVEYKGSISADKREEVKAKLEVELNRLINEGSQVKVIMADYNNIKDLCGKVPDYLQKDHPARIVTLYGTQGCPCGGTHVKNIKEIGSVKIRKILVKGGTTRVGYDVEGK